MLDYGIVIVEGLSAYCIVLYQVPHVGQSMSHYTKSFTCRDIFVNLLCVTQKSVLVTVTLVLDTETVNSYISTLYASELR